MAEGGAAAQVWLGDELGWGRAGGREHRSCPATPLVQVRPTDRIDTSCDGMKAPVLDSMLNRRRAQPERQQLRPRHDPVLASDQLPNVSISRLQH
jgi:hypothetical protein